MITIISSTKSLDLEKEILINKRTMPVFSKEASYLASILKDYTIGDIARVMKVSDKLAEVNHCRYKVFNEGKLNSRQSLFAFSGDVYKSMNPFDYTEVEVEFAQSHMRILSGLFGVLRPLDMIKEYRLEMATKIESLEEKDLYEFWKSKITTNLMDELKESKEKVILNLASLEYSKVIDRGSLKDIKIYDIEFRECRQGKYKVIGTYAKKARGTMVTYIIKNSIDKIDNVKSFKEDGYNYSEELSNESTLVFVR